MPHSKRSEHCEQTLSPSCFVVTSDKYKRFEFPLYSGIKVTSLLNMYGCIRDLVNQYPSPAPHHSSCRSYNLHLFDKPVVDALASR